LSRAVGLRDLSGRGHIYTWTAAYRAGFMPLIGRVVDVEVVLVVVELEEQEGLRLTSELIGTPRASVRIGAAVHVEWETRDGTAYPVFEVSGDDRCAT
jgi:uncharacterized OB-fold protein